MNERFFSGRRGAAQKTVRWPQAFLIPAVLVAAVAAALSGVKPQQAAAPAASAVHPAVPRGASAAATSAGKNGLTLPKSALAGLDPFQQKLLQQLAKDLGARSRRSGSVPNSRASREQGPGQNVQDVGPPAVCFAPGTSQGVMDKIYDRMETNLTRYRQAGWWTSTATNGSSIPLGTPVTLTWSFIPDGTNIPGGSVGVGEPAAGSDLQARLNTIYGSSATWLPIFQQVFDRWAELTGTSYVYQATDDGASFPYAGGSLSVRGDIRIGGHPIDGNSNTLAYNYYPNTGDMVIDTNDSFFTITSSNSLRLRNTIAHEHGHGLGFNHVCPVNNSKLMEPTYNSAIDGPQHDDILAGQRAYGDNLESNDTVATATDLGTLANGTVSRSTISIDDNSDIDYFKFSTSATGKKVSVTLTPTGSTYLEGAQVSGSCTAGTSFDSLTINDLGFELIDSNGTTVLSTRNANAAGVAETLSDYVLIGTGPFYVRIYGGSVDNIQMYSVALTIADAITQAPTIDLNGSNGTGNDHSVTFTEGGGAVAVADADALITDSDSTNLLSLTVTLGSRPDGNAVESLAATTSGTSIVATYVAATGVLSLIGTDTLANYQQVLRTITYNNTSSAPTTTSRSVTFVGNDGINNSATSTSTVSVTAVNNAPTLTLPGGAASYTENAPPTVLDGTATVSDVDSVNFDTGTLTVSWASGGQMNDRFAIQNQGVGSGQIGTVGSNVTYAGTVIGTFAGGSGTTSLVITLNSNANAASVQALARNITYHSVAESPATNARTAQMVLTDGDGGGSSAATKAVNVTAVNDAPVVDLNDGTSGSDTTASFVEDGGPVVLAATATIADVDSSNLASATLTLNNRPNGSSEVLTATTAGTSISASYNSSTGVLSLTGSDTIANYLQVLRSVTYNNTASVIDLAARSISVVVNDGQADSATTTVTVSLTAANDAPSFSIAGNPAASNEDGGAQQVAGFASSISAGPSDENSQTLSFGVSVTGTTGSLTFSSAPDIDSVTGALSYTAAANTFGTATVSVNLSDNGGTANGGNDTSATQSFTITVLPVADSPSISNATTDEDTQNTAGLVITPNAADGAEVTHFKISNVSNGQVFLSNGTTVVPADSFITASQATSGLRFTPAANLNSPGTSFGFDVQAATGSTDLDLGGAAVHATVTVNAVNDTPTTNGPASITVAPNSSSSTVDLFGGFADLEDADSSLTFTVTGNTNTTLITSTSVNPSTGVLTINYASNVSGTATLTVRATDTGGLFVATTLTVTRQPGYNVSGRIADSQGTAIVGVSVSRGNGTLPVVTNGAGYYTLTNVPPGTYTLTTTKSNYTFVPATRSVTVTGTHVANQNFTGTTGFMLHGRIANSAGVQIAGVTVTRSGSATSVTTNSAGYYSFIGVQPGTYTVTPSKSGYRFTPSSKVISVTNANVTNQNFIGAMGYNITGRIANSSGVGQANVSVRRSGSNTAVLTNSAGYYTFTDVPNGSVTITPSGTGLSFTPESRTVTMASADIANLNFVAAPGYTLSGRIATSNGTGVAGVAVTRSGSTTPAVTNGAGYYTFTGVRAGSYTLTPSLDGYTFTPATKTVSITSADLSNQNFIAIAQ